MNKLILEARIDIDRFVRILFTFDDDYSCEASIYTFGFKKKREQEDYYTNSYILMTADVHKSYINTEVNERSDYF